ncbi:MAG: glycosyl hydrolase [Planctomycetota bacterium]
MRKVLSFRAVLTLSWSAVFGCASMPGSELAYASVQEEQGTAVGEPEAASEGEPADEPVMSSGAFAGLRFRSIGPALMSGRIGDLAVNPHRDAEYYVAVSSGNVWKTVNDGITFEPVFDGEGSYSIGCVTLDPNDPNVVWVGTGENNSQRSVSFGDGVYKSTDAGKSWTNVGLPESEHIGMIAIDPRDSDTVYVASQGPLWNPGGDRGLYKTTDGGGTWERILHVSDETGINEVHLDPRDPDVMYASAYQRRRHVWTLINGGPEGGLWKSTDAGASWREINTGLPTEDKGRIGLDISPADPDVVYAIVEAAKGKSGFFRSIDRGESWQRMSDHGTTSPQYYNEIVCHPTDVDTVYSLDTFMHVTRDGGKTFAIAPRMNRHVDDHALWIDPEDPLHMLVGSDGGLYDTHDEGRNWRFMANLPVTQFYRVNVDQAWPFYNIYGGTQDNNTQGGPSRTTDRGGIMNEHWFITVGGDGYETVVDPEDPMMVYSQWQYGGLVRHDRRSGEVADIRPIARPGDEPYVFNWDTPLIMSPHDNQRLYFAGNFLFRSDDRGDNWRIVSPNLTRGIDRNTLEVMGVIQKPDAVSKHRSTSIYGNAVALDESSLVEGLIYVGTDDGLIHITEDAGESWRKIENIEGVPDLTYVSCLHASVTDADVVFATFDNHKMGDFAPYVYRSDDRGRTWTSIASDLPDRDICYVIRQDHVNPDLLFLGTEFAAYFTVDAGASWIKMSGVPTIAVQDLEIQRRENDVVLGTFGRGFYVLDDYSPFRTVSEEVLSGAPVLFGVKDAPLYVERSRLGHTNGKGFQGASFYAAPNPPFGAIFTYHFSEKFTSLTEQRHEREGQDVWDYPSIDELRAEDREIDPQIILTVRDNDGNVVRRVKGAREKGFHRTAWDLRYPSEQAVQLSRGDVPDWAMPPVGPLVAPGAYSVTLDLHHNGTVERLAGPEDFEVFALDLATLKADDPQDSLAFAREASELRREVIGAIRSAGEAESRIRHLRQAILDTPDAGPEHVARLEKIRTDFDAVLVELRGDPTLSARNRPQNPSISGRIGTVVSGRLHVTSPPTGTHREQFRFASESFRDVRGQLRDAIARLVELEKELDALGAPWTPGRTLAP